MSTTIKILVVDDDEMVLNATVRGLRITGYEVHKALDPTEALTLFKAGERFAVVVSDMEMPGLHGDEFCREVQKIAPTPFILCSGNTDALARAKGEEAVAYTFAKPYSPTALREALAELIQRHGAR